MVTLILSMDEVGKFGDNLTLHSAGSLNQEASFFCLNFLSKFAQLYFAVCLHFETNSDLLFRSVFWSAVAILYFALKHRSHRLDPHLFSSAPSLLIACGWRLA